MALRIAILALLSGALCAQQTVNLHVSGQLQSSSTTKRNFGRMPKGYRGADWIVTSDSPAPVKIPLARILQEIHTGPGITILSRVSSTSVVQDAQGRNPINSIARVGSGLIGGLASCEGIHVCGAGGSWPNVILGAELGALLIQSVLPTLPSHALQSITALMPDPVVLDPYGTVPGMIIVEVRKGTTEPPPLDEMISIVIPK